MLPWRYSTLPSGAIIAGFLQGRCLDLRAGRHFVPNYRIYGVYSVFMLPAEVPEKEILQTVKMWVFTQVRKLFPLNQGSAPFGGGD